MKLKNFKNRTENDSGAGKSPEKTQKREREFVNKITNSILEAATDGEREKLHENENEIEIAFSSGDDKFT